MHKAQQYMKKYADKKRSHVEYKVGDQVLVKLQPYRQHSVSSRKNQKLSMRYFSPFPTVERIGQARVILRGSQQEDHSAMVEAFPTFNLEDMVAAKGEGIVTNINEEGANMGNDKKAEAHVSPSGQVAANPVETVGLVREGKGMEGLILFSSL
ncbi:Transposon Ty3-I Gag-Pol polyprotein [Sesbania bispinosa]|nr:Transposon Ty3-I Gag-Pol polyprotein [Sesbania bispinosa]